MKNFVDDCLNLVILAVCSQAFHLGLGLGAYYHKNQLEAHLSLHNEKWSSDDSRRCRLCGKQFTKPVLYRQHLRDHYKLQVKSQWQTKRGSVRHRTTYKCRICAKVFQKPSQLAKHIRVHTGEKPYKCNVCNRGFTQKNSVRRHMHQHVKNLRPYSCSLCHAKFNQRYNLNSHVLRVHNVEEDDRPVYRCTRCTCMFKKLGSLNSHIKRVHNNAKEDKTEVTEEKEAKADEQSTDLEFLAVEKQMEETATANEEQQKKDEDEEEMVVGSQDYFAGGFEVIDGEKDAAAVLLFDKEGDSLKGKYVRIKQRFAQNSKFYECTFCHKTFKKPSDLMRHLRMHTQDKPFKCEVCGRAFTLKSTLQNHENVHKIYVNIPCDVCNIALVSAKALESHKEKCHKCTKCDKKFTNMDEQNSHAAVPCMGRSTVATESSSLADQVVLKEPLVITEMGDGQLQAQPCHRNENAGGTGRPHKCPSCPAAFMKVSHLKQHYLRHTGQRPYACHSCDSKFLTSNALKTHLRIHDRIRPYACAVCGYKFTTLSSMKRHYLTHTNMRSYMCPYCNKTFKSTVNCKKHMRIHKEEILQQQLEPRLTESIQESNKPVIINDQKIVSPFHLNDQMPLVQTNDQVTDNTCYAVTSSSPNMQSLAQNIPVVSEPNVVGSAQTLHAGETGTMTLSNCNGSQTLSPESIRDIEDKLNQQLLGLGVNLTLGNVVKQMDQHNDTTMEAQEQPMLSIIYENGTTLHSPVTVSASVNPETYNPRYGNIDINQIALQNNNAMNIGIVQADSTNMINILSSAIQDNSQSCNQQIKMIDSNVGINFVFQQNGSIPNNELVENSSTLNVENTSATLDNENLKKQDNLQCHICNVQQLSSYDLKEHLKTHEGKKEFQCTYCYSNFCSSSGLSRHMKTHEEVQEKHKCYECNHEFKTAINLRKHIKEHEKEDRKLKAIVKEVANELEQKNKKSKVKKKKLINNCQYCDKAFRKPSDLIRHVRTHTGEKPYQCHYCPKSFAVKCTLMSHLKIHNNEKLFNCFVCNNKFATKGSLKVHIRLHTGSKPFKCSMCDMEFRTSGQRKIHLLTHAKDGKLSKYRKLKKKPETDDNISTIEEEKPAENSPTDETVAIPEFEPQQMSEQTINERAIPQNISVQQSMDIVDQSLTSLPIPDEITFNTDINGDGELLTIDENNQLVANLQYLLANGLVTIQAQDPETNQVSLTTTTIIPSEEFEKCKLPEEAQQVFSFNMESPDSTVSTAIPTNENNLSMTDYMVLQLDSVDSTVQLRNEEASRSPAKSEQSPDGSATLKTRDCEICGKSFAKPCQLERHKRSHTGERPFKCDKCDKSYSQKSSLQLHYRNHTGTKPYSCSQCNKTFVQSSNLNIHMKRVHKIDPAETKRVVTQFVHYDPKVLLQASMENGKSMGLEDLGYIDFLK